MDEYVSMGTVMRDKTDPDRDEETLDGSESQ